MNILLEEPPGTGKTSTIFMLASYLDLKICVLNFNKDMDDISFHEALQSIPRKSILILEDIDSLFVERKKNDDRHNMISFSGLLNILDGLIYIPGLIIFMTTNYKVRLDQALLRPGRIDKIYKLDNITEYQIKNMYKYYLTNQIKNVDKFYNKVNHLKFTTSLLQSFFFQY